MRREPDSREQLTVRTSDELVAEYRNRIATNTSRIFIGLMLLQWAGAIVAALVISPRTWSGTISSIHIHVWAATFLGGLITVLPVVFAVLYPARPSTWHVVAAAQMLMSALLIHVTGGRVETHFHVFGSLALLAFYRDWRVLATAAVVVYVDHLVRGLYWPQSVYGVLTASPWRAVEHAWWVSFEVLFLTIAIRQSNRETRAIADQQAKALSINSQIEAEVKERTAELSAINQQMQTFCYSMSHDLKAPLRGIQSFSQILQQDHAKEFKPEAKQCLGKIGESARKMNRLLDDLLEYSRVSTVDLPLSPVQVSRVVDEAIGLLGAEIGRRSASIQADADLGEVLGHEATLIQVMLNLLSNAVRYGKPDAPPMIKVSKTVRGDRLRISVTDNGIGISPKYHQKIFQIFERVPTASTADCTGVGLAIVAKAIERLGGAVGVDSEPGAGSTFWFELEQAPSPVRVTVPKPELALVSA